METFNLQEWQRSDAEYPEVDFDNAAEKLLAAYHTAQQSHWSHESLCQLCIMADAVYDRLVCSGITQAVSMEEWKTIGQRLVAEYGLPTHEWPGMIV